jgi:hypothetical protein
MNLITRSPTLTGVVVGGTIVRPGACAMSMTFLALRLNTSWICKVTLAPPIEDMPPALVPTILTERRVSPAAA